MNKRSSLMQFWGVVFLALGLAWFAAIYERCRTIAPPAQAPQVASSVRSLPQDMVRIIHFRTPYAEDWHIVLFWVIVCLELACSLGYIISGLALLRGWVWARPMAMSTVSLDLVFKAVVSIYMQVAAIPLSIVTGNKDVLTSYYMPDMTVFSHWSLYFSGLRWSTPGGELSWLLYAAYVLVSFNQLLRLKVKS